MEFIQQFLQVFWHYVADLWLTLAIGFALSGFIFVYLPVRYVERYLGKPGVKPILISSLIGVILPVCCLGSLPIAITLKEKGAKLGAVLAFLVATPATSVTALIVTWKLLGVGFTVYIFFAVIVMAILMGLICSGVKVEKSHLEQKNHDCCHKDDVKKDHCAKEATADPKKTSKLKQAFIYSFVTLPKDIGLEIILGISLASLISVIQPLQHFVQTHLVGFLGYAFVMVFGLLTYVCSTASVPLADALIQSGISHGQALCYLIVGPITSYGTILVIKKDFGNHVLVIYLTVISLSALIFGLIFDIVNFI